ncbi:M4 family metallopeptidase [Ectobacillus panaciterrae]|uniref:M4 family metallopeptidase n=1 Tax=Ectobacillus panaciterrae TaxID=363872 RepID=UPI0004035F8C
MKRKVVYSSLALFIGLETFGVGALPAHANESKVKYNENTPSYIIESGEKSKISQKVPNKNKEEIAFSYLESKNNLFKLQGDIKNHFQVLKEEKDEKTGTYHLKLVEKYNNIPVYGSTQTISLDKNDNVRAFFGQVDSNLEDKNIPTKATISGKKAIGIAKKDIEKEIGKVEYYDDISQKLYIYKYEDKFYLSYLVKASISNPKPGYYHYFIDATDGHIINQFNAINEVTGSGTGVLGNEGNFEVTYKNDKYYLADETRGNGINTYNAKNMNEYLFLLLSRYIGYTGKEITSLSQRFDDPAAVDAHVSAQKVYDYYKNTMGRNSFDNTGAKLISSVHVGKGWNNAAWNGVQMIYGDGDGTNFIPLSAGLDVVGHEITHAVTEHTAGLVYNNESGALNESLSDIMGAMIDRDDWEMGEDIYTPGIQNDSLRSMKDPASQGYPDHYSKRYIGENDNGGVHINSSINNKAAYLISEGGTHYGVDVVGIGREKTEQIYYRTLTKYLTATSNFSMMRQAAIQAATDLYGENSEEVKAVTKAYDAVGVE